jgi:glutamyl-tRNA synthetase
VVEAAGMKTGDLVHAVRVAVTGKTVGPGLYDCLAILGRDRSLARIERALPRCD